MKTEPIRQVRQREARQSPRKAQVVLRRVSPFSVLKFSLLFYALLMVVFMFALLIIYWILGVVGVLDALSRLLSNLGFGGRAGFKVDGGWVFTRVFVVGVVGVGVWSLVNTVVAVIYNLVSDVIGGIKITLAERP